MKAQCNLSGDSGPKRDSRPTDTELNAAKKEAYRLKAKARREAKKK